MSQREDLLAKALAVHHAYEEVTDTLLRLRREDKTDSPEWHEVFAYQQQAIDAWSKLPRAFEYFRAVD